MKKLVSVLMALAILFASALVGFPLTSVTAQAAASVTVDNAVAWIKARADESWWGNVDGANGCQCVDLIYAYYQFLGYSSCGGNACDYANSSFGIPAGSGWYKDSTPSPGAIIAWPGNTWTGQWTTGYAGHVGLVYSVSGSTVYTVETNTKAPYDGSKGAANAKYCTRTPKNAVYIHPIFSGGSAMTSGAGYTIQNGEYHITAYKDPEYGVTVRGVSHNDGANIDLWNDMHTMNHVFIVTYLNNGFYKIINKTTGKSLDVADASTARGANVQQMPYNGNPAQQWSIESAGGGVYIIRAKCSGYYLDLADACIAQGTNIRMWEKTDLYAQGWRFDPWITSDSVSGFTSLVAEDAIMLHWNKVANATKYKLQQQVNGTWQTIAQPTETTYTVTGLKSDTEYSFRIYAVNGNDQSRVCERTFKTAAAVKPVDVTGFTGTATSNSIILKWNKSANATSYKLQQSVNGAWQTIASPTGTTYTVSGLKANTTYNFRIFAQNSSGQSDQVKLTVKTLAELPATVIGFTGTPSINSIVLNWYKSANATEYKLQQSVNGAWQTIASPTKTTYTVTGLKANTTYNFRIFARNASGQSDQTKLTISTIGAPAAVTGFTGTATANSITLKWNKSANATSYKLQQMINGGWQTIASPTGTTYTVTGLNSNTAYNFRIFARNSSGQSAQTKLTVSTIGTPDAVTGFSGTASTSSITLKWNKSANATEYKLQQMVNGAWQTIATPADTTFTVTGLKPNTTYNFRIFARSGSLQSNQVKLEVRTKT